MKQYKHLSAVVALLCSVLLMSACTEQDEISAVSGKVAPLEITLKGCGTRTVITGNTLPDGSQLGIFAVNGGDQIAYENIFSTYTGKQWTIAETVYLTESEKWIYAYYPYSEKAELNSVSVNTREQVDYLYGYAVDANNQMTTVNVASPKANILLKHAMSRVTLHIKKAKANEKNSVVNSVILAGVPLSATLDIRNGDMKVANNGDLVINSMLIKLTDEGENVDILIPPMTNAAWSNMLTLNIDAKYYSVQIPANEWKAGQQYTYTVEVGDSSLTISEVSITPWTDNRQDGIEVGDNNYVE